MVEVSRISKENLVKVGQFWQLKKLINLNHLEVLSLFAFVVNHSK